MSRTRSRAEKLAQEFHIETVVNSVAELAALQPNVVVITVPAEHMHELVQQCSQYTWTILAEKPVGLSLAQASATLEKVQRHNAKVFVALNRRCYASTLTMQDKLKECQGARFIEIFDHGSCQGSCQ